jgi:hypothetical protein
MDEPIQKTRPLVYRNGGQVNPDYLEIKAGEDMERRYNSPTSCLVCKHWDTLGACPAFPGGIPDDIYDAITPHLTKDWRQTGDTVFEPE